MTKKLDKITSIALSRINDTLLITGNLAKNRGLLHGQIGASIFLYHYDHIYEDDLSYNKANEILLNVSQNLESVSNQQYSCGLSGIGVALMYLAENNFIEDVKSMVQIDALLINSVTDQIDYENIGTIYYFIQRLQQWQTSTNNTNIDELSILILKNTIIRFFNAATKMASDIAISIKNTPTLANLNSLLAELLIIQRVIHLTILSRDYFKGICEVFLEQVAKLDTGLSVLLANRRLGAEEFSEDSRIKVLCALSSYYNSYRLTKLKTQVQRRLRKLKEICDLNSLVINQSFRLRTLDSILSLCDSEDAEIASYANQQLMALSKHITGKDFQVNSLSVGIAGLAGLGLSMISRCSDISWSSLLTYKKNSGNG